MAFAPRMLKNAYLRLKTVTGGTFAQYGCQVKRAALVPEPGEEVTYRTLCSTGSWSDVGPTTWTLELEGAQGWDATDGLARFLFDHDGELLLAELDQYGEAHTPTAAEPGMSATVRAVPTAYGGNVDEYTEFEVELPVQGEPTLVTAAWPASDEELVAEGDVEAVAEAA